MIVAVDIRGSEKYQSFIYEIFKKISAQHPEHSFIFIFDKTYDPSFLFSEKINPVIIKPQKIFLLSDRNVSSLLKKYKAEVFVTAKTISQTKVPQCLLAFDKPTQSSLKKAKAIIVDSAFSKTEIIKNYKVEESRIHVVNAGGDKSFHPISFEEKEKIKDKYADGNEFFLINGKEHSQTNLLNILKAFSFFKKRQKSNMQLLVTLSSNADPVFIELLRLYKFKNEVKILENVDKKELATITASAYAYIQLFTDHSFIVSAMLAQVPVITVEKEAIPEIINDAGLYVNSDDNKNIADKMMLIFKDENLRKQLIERSTNNAKKYTWESAADALFKSIEKACS